VVTSRQHQESRRIGLSDRMERRRRHELIGQLLDKGHDLRVEGEAEKAGACLHAATELARAS
jgi:hypothetical protein